MKDQKKIMVSDIIIAIESVINPTGEQPRKAVKATENVAKNIAGQLTRSRRKRKNSRLKSM